MRRLTLPSTAAMSLLAALCTWFTVLTWTGFSEAPWRFLGPLVIGCLIVAVSGALLRAARLPALLVLLGQVALVAVWLNHRFAAEPSLLGWVPTPTSVREASDALQTSMDIAQAYAAPVPETVGAFPPVLIAIGCVFAILVDLLACGLRKVPLAGLPLLAMYTAPVSLLSDGVAWWKFGLVAISFLALLAAEEAGRLGHWGRDLGVDPDAERHTLGGLGHTVWPSARKIGLSATAIAVVVPLFVPTFTSGFLAGAGNGDGNGEGGVVITNPMLNVKRDLLHIEDVPMLEVTTDDPAPAYLRIAVLDEYDGENWKPSKREIPVEQRAVGDLPQAVGLTSGVTTIPYSWHIEADNEFTSLWLPLPFPARQVQVDGDWRYDLSTMDLVSAAEGVTTAGLSYDAVGLDVEPTADQLRAAGTVPRELFNRYANPSNIASYIGEKAAQITAQGANRAEKAALLQNWFALPHPDEESDPSFSYNVQLAADNSSADALRDFLEGSRTGYCEQFAAAMALMARTLSIPSRIAVGFLKPDLVGDDTWVFSTHDMHAWPELYFQGVGWVRFEPTPGSREGTSTPDFTAGLRPTVENTPGATPSVPTTGPSASAQPPDRRLEDPLVNPVGSQNDNSKPWLLYVLVALGVLLVLAVVPRAARIVVRRRRWASAGTAVEQAEAAWAELRDSMIDLRLPWDDGVTVRTRVRDIVPLLCRNPGKGEEHLARVIRNNPVAQAALDRLLMLLERARYARTVPDPEDVKGDVAEVVQSLRIGVERGVRLRADWLPASLLSSQTRRGPTDSGLALSEPSLQR